ncbi:MAG: imidazole glycerol phosphate synthase subunit HisH, partial [Oscillospiraceae bacterium]|nr:imidazole glycerol phosphate synthase subunit HisH [Oscillospiraceae bacterium]
MIAVIDYGAGNIFSVKNALDYLGCENKLTKYADDIKNADGIILPGVGAFPWAMKMLNESGLVDTIKTEAKKKPFLGICLGMQLLFEKSYEFEECAGLGLIKGYVDKIPETDLIIPHMGWNKLEIRMPDCELFRQLSEDEYVYFVHSYKAFCDDKNLYAYCEYGSRVPALVSDGNTVFGAQFHPEKSGETGLKILRNFFEITGRYYDWDKKDFNLPYKFLLNDSSTLAEAI